MEIEKLTWRTSSKSGAAGHCVEVARAGAMYLVRNSKHPTGPVLRYTPQEWDAFIGGVHNGEFDTLEP